MGGALPGGPLSDSFHYTAVWVKPPAHRPSQATAILADLQHVNFLIAERKQDARGHSTREAGIRMQSSLAASEKQSAL